MNTTAISIRPARSDDFTSLWSVATLDSAVLPPEPLMVAEEDGQMVAALSLASGDAVADPFRRTAEAVALLKLRASQVPRADRARPRSGLLRRLRRRPAPLAAAQ
jgi:hypothetical protein